MRALKADHESLQNIYNMLTTALEKINGQERTLADTSGQNQGVKLSVSESFEAEYDAWAKDKKLGQTINVGTTPNVLVGLGAKKQTVIMRSEDILHALRHDGMTDNIMKQIPQMMENPIIVMKSSQLGDKNQHEASRVVMYGNVVDENGAPVIAVLELRERMKGGQILNMQLVKNAYGKDNRLDVQIQKSEILYMDANKKRTNSWLHSLRLQLPSDTTTYDSIGSISYPNGYVKMQGVMYADLLSDASDTKHSLKEDTDNLKPTEDERFRFSLKETQAMSWEEQVTKAQDMNMPSSATLSLGQSGSLYQEYDMQDKPLGLNLSDLRKMMRGRKGSRSAHGLDRQTILALPGELQNPVATFENTQRNSVYVVTALWDSDDFPVIAVIAKDQIDNIGTPMHQIKSAYGMEDIMEYMIDHLSEEDRYHVYKKENFTTRAGSQYIMTAPDYPASGSFGQMVSQDSEAVKFSLRETDENVQESLATLKELFALTSAHRMTDKEADWMAGKVLKEAQSDYNRAELAGKFKWIFDYVERGKGVSMEDAAAGATASGGWEGPRPEASGTQAYRPQSATAKGGRAYLETLDSELNQLAEDVMAQSKTLDVQHEERVQPVRDYLRKTAISLTETQQREAANAVGSLGAYRRMLFGRVRLNNSGTKLDSLWSELNALDAGMFPADASEGEMVALLLDAVDEMAPIYQNANGLNAMEATQYMANFMSAKYLGLAGVQNAAKEREKFGIAWRAYHNITERFAREHKAAFDEAMAKVKAQAGAEVEQVKRKADEQRRLDRLYAEADAAVYARGEIAKAEQKAAADREAYMEAMRLKNKEWRDKYRANTKETGRKQRYRAQIVRMTDELTKKLEKPTDKKHIKAGLDEPVLEFLQSLKLGSKNKMTRSLGDRIGALARKMQNPNGDSGDNTQYMIDPELVEDMKALAEETKSIGSMTELNADQMRDMRDMVKAVQHIVNTADQTFTLNKRITTSQYAQRSMDEMSRKRDKKQREGFLGAVDDLVNNGMLDSFRFFDRLGGTAREVYQSVRDGFDRKVRRVSEANDYVQEHTKGIDKAILKGGKAKKTTFEVSGGVVELTKGQVMELYCLNKRDQARGHIYGGGIRSGETGSKAEPVHVNEADIERITGTLTEAERKVADALQAFLAKNCAEWGNETSMTLYGYRKFGEKNYYPIRVDTNTTQTMQTEAGQDENLYAIINMGMTRQLKEHANNALMIGDIFDTFSRHVDNMSTYNGLAAPIADMLRWFNWRGESGSVKTMLEKKFGAKGRDYISTLIRDLSGATAKAYSPGIAEAMTRRAKSP